MGTVCKWQCVDNNLELRVETGRLERPPGDLIAKISSVTLSDIALKRARVVRSHSRLAVVPGCPIF